MQTNEQIADRWPELAVNSTELAEAAAAHVQFLEQDQLAQVSAVTTEFHRLLAEHRLAQAAAPVHDWLAEELLLEQWETAADTATFTR